MGNVGKLRRYSNVSERSREEKAEAEAEWRNAANQIIQFTILFAAFVDPSNGLDGVIPNSVLKKAKGFALFSVFRIGFLMSARAGSGIVIAKDQDGSEYKTATPSVSELTTMDDIPL